MDSLKKDSDEAKKTVINSPKMTVGKFQWSNSGIAVNSLFGNKKGIDTARRLELNKKCRKQAKLLVIQDKQDSLQAA